METSERARGGIFAVLSAAVAETLSPLDKKDHRVARARTRRVSAIATATPAASISQSSGEP